MTSTTRKNGKMTAGSDQVEYRQLVDAFPPRPISNDRELDRTWAQIEALLSKSKRSKAEDDYLAVLSDLVERWEEEHVEIPRLDGIELVRELLDDNQLPQRALTDIFGTDSIVSEVLSGKRELQRKHIEGLAEFFNVSPAAFFRTSVTSLAFRQRAARRAAVKIAAKRIKAKRSR
jgi:HTH-type transcriptional regulator/antitoxin HigA